MVGLMKNALSALKTSLLSAHARQIDGELAGNGAWIKLIPAGTFSGRDGRGPYHAGDRASIEQIAAMTRSYAGSTELVVDYEHQTLNIGENGKPAPAAGWIKEVEARDDGLYGRIEWTASAQAAIEAKEYRYISPVYFHTKAGKVLALQHVALTNTPNLNELAEVSAHSLFQKTSEDKMDEVIAALGLSEGASEDDVLVAVNALLTGASAIAVAAGMKKDAKSEDVLTAVQSAFADRKAVATAVGQDEAATGDTLVGAVRSAMKAGNPDPTKFVPIEQVSAMQADIKALKDEAGSSKAEEAVADAIRAGKLAPALKEWGLSMHKADPAKFAEFIGKAPVLTSAQRATTTPPDKGSPVLDDNQEAVIAAMGLDREAYLKTLAADEKGA